VGCATPAQPIGFQAYGRAVHEHTERRQRLGQERPEQVKAWRLPPVVEALEALRGVPCTGAVTLGAARGDRTRVETPRPRMKDLGLIPAESSRGARRRPGAITTAGNPHARRALVEGAWADRYPANVRRPRPRRLEPHPKTIQDLRWKAPVRRCQRARRLIARGQHANPVVVAMARELADFLGAMATQVPGIPSSRPTLAIGPILQTAYHV
jgi:transposase